MVSLQLSLTLECSIFIIQYILAWQVSWQKTQPHRLLRPQHLLWILMKWCRRRCRGFNMWMHLREWSVEVIMCSNIASCRCPLWLQVSRLDVGNYMYIAFWQHHNFKPLERCRVYNLNRNPCGPMIILHTRSDRHTLEWLCSNPFCCNSVCFPFSLLYV